MSDKNNTEIWNRLGKTDPAHTSKFQRAGGFKGTAIRPIYSIHRMTEEFGPCGIGWGVNEPQFQIVHGPDEALVFCTVSIWHGARENVVFGVGGDKAVVKFSSGIKTDDEAFKKAFTDAMTNAMKLIGVGADVHMGRFDDSKYVAELEAEKRQNPHVNRAQDFHTDFAGEGDIPTVDSPKMKVKDARPAYEAMVKEMRRIDSVVELGEWGQAKAPEINAMPGDWPAHFRAAYVDHKKSLLGEDA
jgi:hypothetical protein